MVYSVESSHHESSRGRPEWLSHGSPGFDNGPAFTNGSARTAPHTKWEDRNRITKGIGSQSQAWFIGPPTGEGKLSGRGPDTAGHPQAASGHQESVSHPVGLVPEELRDVERKAERE